VEGPVQHGDKRGRQIGFPTANIGVWAQQMVPRNGVYAGWLTIGGERFKAVTNVGVRPTFDGQDVTVETHILDFDREIYNTHVHLTLETFLRPERKFDGLPSLTAQLKQDVAQARAYLDANTRTGSPPTF